MKQITVLSFGTLSALLLVPFAGCSSSSNSPADGGGPSGIMRVDSGGNTATGGGEGGGGGGGGDAGPACLMPVTNFQTSTYVSATPHLGSCSPSDVSTFLAACVDGTDASACNDWLNANIPRGDAGAGTTCGACLFAPQDNGAAWVDPNIFAETQMLLFNPNYAACVQLLDATNGAACGAAINNSTSCENVACNSCVSDTDFNDCVTAVDGAACLSYANTAQSACASDVAAGGAFVTCSPGQVSNNIDDDWNLIIGMLCGSGEAGGGGTGGDQSEGGAQTDGATSVDGSGEGGHVDGG